MTRVAIAAIDVLLDRGYGKVRVDLESGRARTHGP